MLLTRHFTTQALDALVLKCPAEITPFLGNIIQAGAYSIKYDPVRAITYEVRVTLTLSPELCWRRRRRR